MDTVIIRASLEDVAELVTSATGLFAEDGGVHDPFMDTTWPEREGEKYYTDLVNDSTTLVLLGRLNGADGPVVGHLVGRVAPRSPLRPGAVTAILESMRVTEEHRRKGIGADLVSTFLAWARAAGANQATVTAYASNDTAIGFYRSHGFDSFELAMHRPLHVTYELRDEMQAARS